MCQTPGVVPRDLKINAYDGAHPGCHQQMEEAFPAGTRPASRMMGMPMEPRAALAWLTLLRQSGIPLEASLYTYFDRRGQTGKMAANTCCRS